MRIPVPLKVLFGAQAVVSTKGPRWRINQFAGFAISSERCYSFTANLLNLTNKSSEVTISYGMSLDSAAAQVTFLLAPGEIKAVLLPMVQEGKTLTFRTSQSIALLEVVGHQISSGWSEAPGKIELTGLPLRRLPVSIAGELPAGATGQLSCSGADCHFLQFSTNGVLELSTEGWKLRASGFFTLLLDGGTSSSLYLRFPAKATLTLSSKHFADRSSEWIAPSGMPIWVV